MKVKDVACNDNPIDGHDKFCPIWIVGDRIMTECECELINKVRVDMLDAAEQSVTSIPYTGVGYPFVIRAEALAAIRGLREEK